MCIRDRGGGGCSDRPDRTKPIRICFVNTKLKINVFSLSPLLMLKGLLFLLFTLRILTRIRSYTFIELGFPSFYLYGGPKSCWLRLPSNFFYPISLKDWSCPHVCHIGIDNDLGRHCIRVLACASNKLTSVPSVEPHLSSPVKHTPRFEFPALSTV